MCYKKTTRTIFNFDQIIDCANCKYNLSDNFFLIGKKPIYFFHLYHSCLIEEWDEETDFFKHRFFEIKELMIQLSDWIWLWLPLHTPIEKIESALDCLMEWNQEIAIILV